MINIVIKVVDKNINNLLSTINELKEKDNKVKKNEIKNEEINK